MVGDKGTMPSQKKFGNQVRGSFTMVFVVKHNLIPREMAVRNNVYITKEHCGQK